MSKYSLFLCDNCDFQYEHVDRVFYFNEDLTEINEEALMIMTSRAKTASLISGFILVWYCPHCKEFVTEYDLTDNKSDLSINEVEQLIRKVSKHENIIFFSEIVGEDGIHQGPYNAYRKCEKCGNVVDSIWNFDKCPACNKGKLHLVDKFIFD